MGARTGRTRRWLANPIASLVLLGVLVGDALTLPRDWRESTVVGGAIRTLLGAGARPTQVRIGEEFYLARDASGMRFIDLDTHSSNELTRRLSDGTPVAGCMFRDVTYRSGLWAFTRECYLRHLLISPLSGEWSAEDIRAARTAAFDPAVVPRSQLERWSDVAGSDIARSRLLWPGVAHNAFALAVLTAVLYSLTGWRAWLAAHPWSRASRRRARGQCPVCGYDMRGIGEAVCPECGNPSGASSEPRA